MSVGLSCYSSAVGTAVYVPKHMFQIREFRVFRRRRLKLGAVRSQLGIGNGIDLPFHDFISQFPSPYSLQFIAPLIGFVSGATLFLSNSNNNLTNSNNSISSSDIGEWVLFTSPTPFNRFVLLRCPSISRTEFLEEWNFTKLESGRIRFDSVESGRGGGEKLEYQRMCVRTNDGGVISLDWPANLDLREEHGLDTTVVLVPGTPLGSLDWNVKSFVGEALRRGCFPIVMNPRGCAGSPLTTPRLFSAADSDDISTALQFIVRVRPWTTLMGVGWGYGANMLTKYLAEVGESTPLTAATCIDNPFDLEEATRSSPHQMAIDEELVGGLVDILRSNKELFQGKTKRFDVGQALSAKSVHDFEKAISMVSYGFETIEDFYSRSSTRGVVRNVKIPVLFIQKDDGSAPLFSVPRSLIAENPFTSLLLCSYLPSRVIDGGRSALSWCQHLTIEWLAAVELGLLKGRHPLLKDVDLNINPLEGLALMEGRVSKDNGMDAKLLDLTQSDSLNGYPAVPKPPINSMPEESDTAASFGLRSKNDSWRKSEVDHTRLQDVENGALDQTSSDDQELVNEEEVSPEDGERGQVLQTAEVVMNMLDGTMPNALSDEKKKKVLTAINQGDTLMKALQDAVPEDVRGTLTSTVSGILHAQGSTLKFDQILGMTRIPDVSSKIQDKLKGISGSESSHEDLPDVNKSQGGQESENQPSDSERTENISSVDQSQSSSNDSEPEKDSNESGSDISESAGKDTSEPVNDRDESLKVKAPINSEKGSEPETNINNSGQAEIVGGAEEAVVEEQRDDDGKAAQLDTKEEEGNDIQKRDDTSMQPVMDQGNNFNVSEALDALTGIDDNTQLAVNNVFGVIENMISQLEEGSEHENEVNNIGSVSGSGSSNDHLSCDNSQEDSEASKPDQSVQLDRLINIAASNNHVSGTDVQPDAPKGRVEKPNQSPISVNGYGVNSRGSDTVDHVGQDKSEKKDQMVGMNILADGLDMLNTVKNVPLCITSIPNGTHQYLLSKVPTKSLDLDSTTSLLLDYFPEEGQWKLLEQPGHAGSSVGNVATLKDVDQKIKAHAPAKATDEVIEPSYVILDTEKHHEPVEEFETMDNMQEKVEIGEDGRQEFMLFVKNIILNTLKVEVGRRLSAADMIKMEPYLAEDVEQVASAVSFSVGHDKRCAPSLKVEYDSVDCTSEKVGTLHGEHVIRAISSAVHGTRFLGRVLPVGVIVGPCLAALRNFFVVATVHDYGQTDALTLPEKISGEKDLGKASGTKTHHMPVNKSDQNTRLDSSVKRKGEMSGLKNINNTVMVGAVTAALGASALLVEHQANRQDSYNDEETSESSSKSLVNGNGQWELDKLEEAMTEKNQNNIVTSLAEKAMSVAGPVVPTKEDGGVDQERLVAMLANLGQRGGMLKLVGKLALLWGGLRGAMSLTDKLIQFLHIAERPLIQRIFGFVGMVLVLWSPVVIPLLPSFLQSWTTNTSSRIAELACIVGLYTAFMILVVLWGKRIRGYENPLQEYGLDLTSFPKLCDFLKGLIGGVMLVLSIQSVNTLLGCASLAWPYTPSSLGSMAQLKVYGKVLTLVGHGIITATGVALVEELLFRSWLPQEIAADLGYHQGIIISGLAFALCQRSPWSIPGLWLLSLSLAGARERNQGSLSVPIGLRAGVIASSFILQKGGFLTYRANCPHWVMGTHTFQPFSGLTGLSFALCLAIILYPRQPLHRKNLQSTMEESKEQHTSE